MVDQDTADALCARIEMMCRYSALDAEEVDGQTMKDRDIVSGLYVFYRNGGDDEDTAARKARTTAIRLILAEELL